jgi:hypothetical protein
MVCTPRLLRHIKPGLYRLAFGISMLSKANRSATAASMLVVQTSPVVEINRSSSPETCYTRVGISHQEPCGIAVHRHAEPSVPRCLLPERTEQYAALPHLTNTRQLSSANISERRYGLSCEGAVPRQSRNLPQFQVRQPKVGGYL